MSNEIWKVVAYVLAVGLICVLALMLFAQQAHGPIAVSSLGTVVFTDDFERAELGELYQQGAPDPGHKTQAWRIQEFCSVQKPIEESDVVKRAFQIPVHRAVTVTVKLYCDRRLVGENIHNAALWLQRDLPDKTRVEFKATPLTKKGDVKAEIFGDGKTHQSGYILIMGGWSNQLNIIARQDEHGEDRKRDNRCVIRDRRRACATKDQTYNWAIERDGSTLKWYIDGVLFMTYPDRFPLSGRHFGFNNWEARVAFDNLRIMEI